MVEAVLKIEGMMCGMCEAHINDTVRRNFAVEKVTSSHKKGETVILSERPLDRAALEKAIEETGYRPVGYSQSPYEKKTGFRLFGRKA